MIDLTLYRFSATFVRNYSEFPSSCLSVKDALGIRGLYGVALDGYDQPPLTFNRSMLAQAL